ncbi:hypothetical protein O7599_02495 [Streptomyces sp. WMMC500]|uniref:hypothetical protein n=1 Tax=Streptomyces sp. WMMC500 TaxID=3015154 RepID=UPI00248B51E5|nr:hypothetical protein [Streptomyces sp. WMMC500]WBB61445.1 hypothetical protein O7599_02495 [Streptomyces sp. WMMC500]
MMPGTTAAVLGALVLLGAGCGAEETVKEPRNTPATPHVEVDALSGRPNPGWDLPQADADEIAALIEALPAGTESAAADDAGGLGFRGFVLTDLRLPRHPEHDRVRVGVDVVRIETGDVTLALPDDHGSVHAALRAKARTRLPEPLYRAIPENRQ